MPKVAINGLGRIGRALFRILETKPDLEVVAVNDLVPPENLAYLLSFDTVHGAWGREVKASAHELSVDGQTFSLYAEKDPSVLPWKELGVDAVFECTGVFTSEDGMKKHLSAGAKHVVLSAPAKDASVPTFVYGVNTPDTWPQLFSCASCTTNCIAPVMEILDRRLGVAKGLMTTVHAYTSSQAIVDGPAKKWTRGRAAAANFVPTTTGAAKATTLALPALKNLFDGMAMRGPVADGSVSDITVLLKRAAEAEEVNGIFREEAATSRYKDVFAVSEWPMVSSDIIGNPHGSVLDPFLTAVVDGDMLKVVAFYDNEWGYTNQMVRCAQAALAG